MSWYVQMMIIGGSERIPMWIMLSWICGLGLDHV
jgi:hypothetical protein